MGESHSFHLSDRGGQSEWDHHPSSKALEVGALQGLDSLGRTFYTFLRSLYASGRQLTIKNSCLVFQTKLSGTSSPMSTSLTIGRRRRARTSESPTESATKFVDLLALNDLRRGQLQILVLDEVPALLKTLLQLMWTSPLPNLVPFRSVLGRFHPDILSTNPPSSTKFGRFVDHPRGQTSRRSSSLALAGPHLF